MKNLVKILVLALTMLLCVSMVACSSYGRVEKALANIGYEKIESDETAENMKDESEVAVSIHVLTNKETLALTEAYKINIVIVLEFNETEQMMEFYQDSDTLQGLVSDVKEDGTADEFYNSLVEKGFAKGNCLVVCLNPLAMEDVATAIKNA